jgi:hypothetical protein
MNLQYDPYTNVVMGFFQPPSPDVVIKAKRFTFDADGLLVMTAPTIDDALAPNLPRSTDGPSAIRGRLRIIWLHQLFGL